jgi:hypothetical protein
MMLRLALRIPRSKRLSADLLRGVKKKRKEREENEEKRVSH